MKNVTDLLKTAKLNEQYCCKENKGVGLYGFPVVFTEGKVYNIVQGCSGLEIETNFKTGYEFTSIASGGSALFEKHVPTKKVKKTTKKTTKRKERK